MTQSASNPLLKHFRQPAIQLRLPSAGNFWPEKSINVPTNGELPVYPMTTKDEVIIRTPDSLLNGATVVSVIQSCIPEIKDAWMMPSIDVDAALISIRIASYGHSMEISSECPHCQHKNEYNVDLRNVLNNIKTPNFAEIFNIDGLKIKLKPQPYYSVNKVNMIRFEEQKIIQQLSDTSISSEARMEAFRSSIHGLVDLNIDVLTDSTEYIQLEDNRIVNDYGFIKEFYQNCESKITKQLQGHFAELNQESGAKEIDVTCDECSTPYTTSLNFDYSSFFE